jgi:hypothetical protein
MVRMVKTKVKTDRMVKASRARMVKDKVKASRAKAKAKAKIKDKVVRVKDSRDKVKDRAKALTETASLRDSRVKALRAPVMATAAWVAMATERTVPLTRADSPVTVLRVKAKAKEMVKAALI